MSAFYYSVIFCTFLPLSHSLKLLVENEQWESGIPEEWESDITFSYKPMTGRCDPSKSGIANIVSGDGGYSGTNKMCSEKCLKSGDKITATAADLKKYCKPTKTDGSVTADDAKFTVAADDWKASLVKDGKQKECAHVYAKLITMANTEETCSKEKVRAFDIKADTCVYRAYKGSGDVTTATAEGYFCYGPAEISWVKNDPKVKNMDGEEFEIMATGTFSLISLTYSSTQKTALEILSSIDRAGTQCGATYIQNITLQGQWVEDSGFPQIQIRADAGVPKLNALRVNFEGSWQPANRRWSYASVQQASSKKIELKLNTVTVLVSIDSHRIHENGVTTRRFANFLNVNLQGIETVSGISIGGLLGRDSHTAAAQIPEGCASVSLLNADADLSKSWSLIDVKM